MIYSFGNTVVDEHRRAVYRGADWIMVEPKVFDVLLHLVKNRDRVVTRQELLEACWPNIYVSDGTLSRCVSRVRRAVDQPRAASQPIFTLHGKGYRFVDPVTVSEAGEAGGGHEPESADAPIRPEPAPEAERRVISVVDCALDLRGPRDSVDAERLYDALEELGAICRDVAGRFGGTYSKSTCEGAELRFGEPCSVERAAESAVLAGFELIERARQLGMTARVGVTSGRAIVKSTGEGTGRFSMVVEIDPLRPSALRAGPNQCVADENTRQLVQASFDGEPLGDVTVMGSQVPVFLLSPRSVQRSSCADDMPFFGRSSELAFLQHCWRYAAGGQGQTVRVTGAMGVGKTRLVQELLDRTGVAEESQLRLRCSPHHRLLPFYPLALLLCDLLGAQGAAPPSRLDVAVKVLLKRLELAEGDHLANLTRLLSALCSVCKLELCDLGQAPRRESVIETLVAVVLATAAQRPTILWVDDIQWADADTLAVIEEIRAQATRRRLLVILAGRQKKAGQREAVGATSIVLHPFSQVETRNFLNSRCDGPPLSAKLIDWVVERSDGVPLFLCEILRMVLTAPAKFDRQAIPQSLQWQLQSVLDEAAEAKQVVQWAALLGRSFTSAVLAVASKIPAEALQELLDRLTAIGLLSEGGCGGCASFRFNHDLVRDFAYASMLGRQRRERHRQIAETLIAEFPHIAARDPEAVAAHLARSDKPERAAEYRRQSQQATQLAAWRPGEADAPSEQTLGAAYASLELLPALPTAGNGGKPLCGQRRRVA